jgi:hypothetical protein
MNSPEQNRSHVEKNRKPKVDAWRLRNSRRPEGPDRDACILGHGCVRPGASARDLASIIEDASTRYRGSLIRDST